MVLKIAIKYYFFLVFKIAYDRDQQAKTACSLFLSIKLYWNRATLILLCIAPWLLMHQETRAEHL